MPGNFWDEGVEGLGWLDRLDRKFGKYGIRNLMLYITALNGIVFLLGYLDSANPFLSKLTLVPSLVMQGEVWRLVTFLFIPPATSAFWLIFVLYFYYMIGSTLENEWGSFKFNIYYFIGVIGTIAAAFLDGGTGTAMFLNLSLIFAFSYLFPDYQILLFFIIPVKMKYLSWFYLALLIFMFIGDPLNGLITIGGSIANFLLFFGKDIVVRLATGRKVYQNRRSFESKMPRDVIIHRCSVCGRTERDDKDLEFRYCVDCEGDYEYCMDHLYTHEHVKGGPEGK
jgi:membrane associated rhomboid family serine protease